MYEKGCKARQSEDETANKRLVREKGRLLSMCCIFFGYQWRSHGEIDELSLLCLGPGRVKRPSLCASLI